MRDIKYKGASALSACRLNPLSLAVASLVASFASVDAIADNRGLVLEEVVVEARRREESLQDVPIAITAFSSDDMDKFAMNDIRSAQDLTPGLNIEEGFDAGAARFFIRGLGTAVDGNGVEPGVGIYIDDVYVPTGVGSNFDLFSLERIEVLRGPQGTLYGRNTFGGAIKLYSKEFTDVAEGYINLKAGSFNGRDVKAEYSAPIIDDKLWINAGYAHLENDGIQNLVHFDKKGWAKNTDVYKLRLKAQVTDDLDVTVTYDRTESDAAAKHPKIIKGTDSPTLTTTTASFFGPIIGPGLAAALQDAPAIQFADIDTIESDINSNTSNQSESLSWGIGYQVNDNIKVKYHGSIREADSLRPYDVDGKVSPFLTVNFDDSVENENHEFRVHFDYDQFNLVAGVFYYTEDQGHAHRSSPNVFSPLNNLPGLLSILDEDQNGVVSAAEAAQIVVTDLEGNPTGYALTQSSNGNEYTNGLKSTAAFMNASYAVTDKLSVSAGIRYTKDKRTATVSGGEGTYIGGSTIGLSGNSLSLHNGLGFLPTPGAEFLINPTSVGATVSRDFTNVSPSFTMDYQLTEDQLIYGSWKRGFQAGQLFPAFSNLQAVLAAAKADDGIVDESEAALLSENDGSTDEQTVDAFEIGFKASVLDGRATFNTSAYYYKIEDLIASIPILIKGVGAPTVGRAVPTNAGSATISGLEVEGQFLVTENVRLYGNVAYSKFELDEILAPNPANPSEQINVKSTYIDTPVLSPELQGTLGMEYFQMFDNGAEFSTYVNVTYRSEMGINARALGETFGIGLAPKVEGSPERDKNYISPSLTKVNIGATYIQDSWQLGLTLKNLTDERRPVATRFDSTGFLGLSQTFDTPRTWELSLTHRF